MGGTINLKGLLSVIASERPVTINLFNNANSLLIISFVKDGYEALEDTLELADVKKIIFKNVNALDIYIDVA